MNQNRSDGRGARLAKVNTVLGALVLLTLALSAYAYRDSVRRAERFERGQDFLPSLNPDEVATINLSKGGEMVALRREDERFVVVSQGRYPAANESVNRLLRDLLGLTLEKEVGSGDDLEVELGLGDDGEEMLEVLLQDSASKDMVRFRIGDSLDGGGSYVVRTDGDEQRTVYLTSSRVFLNTGGADYVDKEIVNEPATRIVSVQGPDYSLAREEDGDDLELADLPSGKSAESAKINQLGTLLAGLRFTAHHQADASEVSGLRFEPPVEIVLDDGSGYRLEVAAQDEKHYLRIVGFHTAGRIEVAMDASEEEVRETSEVLVRADEINAFNQLHGSWIYEIPSFTADKLRLQRTDLIES